MQIKKEIKQRLDNIKDIPSIPTIASEVLRAMEDPLAGAKQTARIIDKDQSLTAKILRRANSPLYGFSRQVSTIDVAVMVLGNDSIREIIMSYIVQGFFSKVNITVFNIMHFWEYSLYSASASRILARRLKYKLAGEAFIAGLMHDIGIMIIAEFFTEEYIDIKELVENKNKSLIDAENLILGITHQEIGYWFAEKWNLPKNLCESILNHHTHYSEFESDIEKVKEEDISFINVKQQLTAIVSMSEWLAFVAKKSTFFLGDIPPPYYLAEEIFPDITDNSFIDESSSLYLLQKDIENEFEMIMEEYKF